MSEMNVSMRLVLQDLASGPLRAFADQIKALEPAVAALNSKFSSLSKTIGSFGATSDRGAAGMGKFADALGVLGERLQAIEAKLGASAESFAGLGAAAADAGASVTDASKAIGASAAAMDAAAASAGRAKAEMSGMSAVMRDMVGLFAAFEAFKGIKASVSSGAELATLQAQMRMRGATQAQINAATQGAYANAKAFPMVSVNEALGARLALMTATGGTNPTVYGPVLQQILQNAKAYQLNFNKHASLADVIGNMGGLAEIRGMSQTPAGLLQASSDALKVAEATSGRMKLGSQEIVARQYKYGGAMLENSTGYYRMMALAEQQTLAGHEGGSGGGRGVSMTGTAYGMLLKVMNGGTMSKQTYDMLRAMDMFSGAVKQLTTATTRTYTSGALIGSISGQKDPAEWVRGTLLPHMIALALANKSQYFPNGDVNNARAQEQALNRIAIQTWGQTGGVNVSDLVSKVSNPQIWDRIEKTMQIARTAPTGAEAVGKSSPFDQATAKLTASLSTLSTTIGTQLVPQVTKIANVLSTLFGGLADLSKRFPTLSKYVADAVAAFSAFFALKIVAKFVGLSETLGKTTGLFGVLGRAARALGGWLGGVLWVGAEKLAGAFGTGLAAFEDLLPWVSRAAALFSDLVTPIAALLALFHARGLNTGEQAQLDAWRALVGPTDWGLKGGWGAPSSAPPSDFSAPPSDFTAPPSIHAKSLASVFAPRTSGRHKPTPQELAAGWGLQDLHRAEQQANREASQWASQVRAARALIHRQQPNHRAADLRQAASVLAASGDAAGSLQALQMANAQETQDKLKAAQDHLAGLQSDLAGKAKYNAALVTSGVLTPDQAQQQTLADQRAAQPDLLQAARAVQALTPAGTAAASAIQATIVKLQQLGTGLTQFQQKLYNGFQGAFAGLFEGLMKHQKTLRQQLEAFFQSLANTMMQTMSQQLAQGLMSGFMGSGTVAGGALRQMGGVGQIGQLMGSGLNGWLGGMFASSNNGTGAYTAGGQVYNNPSAYTASSSTVASSGFWSGIGSWLASIGSSFAAGADYVPHDMVAQIHQGEMIVPKKGADAIRSGALAGHQSNFNGNVNVTVQHNGFTGMSGNGNSAQQSLGMMVGEHVRQIMLQEMRPGGILSGARP